MPALQPARGTQDLLPETARRHRRVDETARDLAALYGFAEIATPILEFTEVFTRPIGEHTDIVAKEMYTFHDRGGDELTLRPENTAGVVRAVLSNGLTQSTPLKFFYSGPMFRYERPQKGRFRQFHQIGVEILGVPQPHADVEIIALGHRILKELGIGDRVVLVKVSSQRPQFSFLLIYTEREILTPPRLTEFVVANRFTPSNVRPKPRMISPLKRGAGLVSMKTLMPPKPLIEVL